MKYVFTKGQKRLQQNLLIQLWRFFILSLKFMKLTQTDFSKRSGAGNPGESKDHSSADQGPDIKLVYQGEAPTTAPEKISESSSSSSMAQKAR